MSDEKAVPEKTKTVSKDMADQEFDRFTEAMDLDLDTNDMDPEDLTAFNKQKSKIVKAIMLGSLVVNDNGEAVYTPRNAKSKYDKPLTFHERTGASLMAMDGTKKNHDVTKTYKVLADMCKVHPSTFAGLVGIDVKICEALFALLMD